MTDKPAPPRPASRCGCCRSMSNYIELIKLPPPDRGGLSIAIKIGIRYRFWHTQQRVAGSACALVRREILPVDCHEAQSGGGIGEIQRDHRHSGH
jgi:hypothetical protein